MKKQPQPGRLITYLTFNGNCKEAMTFYQHCLGGELTFQTVGESPESEGLPKVIKEYVLEAVLRNGNMVLRGTDLTDDPLVQGNTMSILMECEDEVKMRHYYEKLAEAGQETHPIANNFFGGLYGMLTDRFGFQWLLRCRH